MPRLRPLGILTLLSTLAFLTTAALVIPSFTRRTYFSISKDLGLKNPPHYDDPYNEFDIGATLLQGQIFTYYRRRTGRTFSPGDIREPGWHTNFDTDLEFAHFSLLTRIKDQFTAFTFNTSRPPDQSLSIGLPLSLPLLLTAILPARYLLLRHKAKREKNKTLCPTCHYDLRATPTQCPECGHIRTPS